MEARVIETAHEALGDLDEYLSAVTSGRFDQGCATGKLTGREIEVLGLLADGFSTDEVAERLSLSPHTIRSRIKAALRKLGAHTRAQAIAIAIRDGAL